MPQDHSASEPRPAGPGGSPQPSPWAGATPPPRQAAPGTDFGGAGPWGGTPVAAPGATGEAPWMPAPWTPPPWTPPQWRSGDAAPATTGPARRSGRRGNGRSGVTAWLPVALVAALVGAGVGVGVTEAVGHGNGAGVTVAEGTATPGAAVLSGNITIPQLVRKVLPAIVSIDVRGRAQGDEGTGMILSSSGEVITNNHVVELAETTRSATITVTESGKTTSTKQRATLVGADQTTDVALLQIATASNLPTVVLGDSAKAQVGDAVVAIGNALGLAAGTPTVTQGIVSALGRTVTAGGASVAQETLTNLIQTDAAINPGNSGGPLIDTAGQVIGMNTAIAGSTGTTSAQNIGFAIPSGKLESLLPSLQKGGTANGGVLGVEVETLTSQLRQQYGFTPTAGAVVQTVVGGSPAGQAGLRQGDVIVALDGTPVTSAEQLQSFTQQHQPGDRVQVTYYRGDLQKTATVTLESETQLQQQQSQTPLTPTSATRSPTGTTGGSVSPFGS